MTGSLRGGGGRKIAWLLMRRTLRRWTRFTPCGSAGRPEPGRRRSRVPSPTGTTCSCTTSTTGPTTTCTGRACRPTCAGPAAAGARGPVPGLLAEPVRARARGPRDAPAVARRDRRGAVPVAVARSVGQRGSFPGAERGADPRHRRRARAARRRRRAQPDACGADRRGRRAGRIARAPRRPQASTR